MAPRCPHMAPTFQPNISKPQPWVALNIEGGQMDFLLNTEAMYSALLSNPRLCSTHQITVKGGPGKPLTRYFS
jgi:hypothetical protein